MKYIDKEYVEKIVKYYNDGKVISRRKNIFYKGIENTLNANVYYVLNDYEKSEYAKCYNDIIYFIEQYLHIKLRSYQKEWIKLYQDNRFIIYNVARQTGYNTIISAVYLHNMIFHYKKIFHLSKKQLSSVEIINNIKMYYYKLPYFLKPSINLTNKTMILFTNGGTINTKNSYTNYDSYTLQDYAHDEQLHEQFINFIPQVCASNNKKIILTSTPNGKNYFYDLYKNSVLKDEHPDKNNFKSIQTYWYEVEGRDLKWKDEEIKRLGSKEKFDQEHDLEF